MKLATLKNGTRDGKLVVVSKNFTRCTDVSAIAPPLQKTLDYWSKIEPKLRALSQGLENGETQDIAFNQAPCPAPRRLAA